MDNCKNEIRMKVYTKTGDSGKTGLIGGTRVAKHDVRLEGYGTVDELNSYIGLLSTFEEVNAENIQFLRFVQNKLFSVGAHLATDRGRVGLQQASLLTDEHVSIIEAEIDRLDAILPPLTNFVLPGGTQASAVCHVCRTVARRAERCVCALMEDYPVDNQVLVFLNRLSDYFFVFSRYLVNISGCQEIYWKTLEK